MLNSELIVIYQMSSDYIILYFSQNVLAIIQYRNALYLVVYDLLYTSKL